MISAQTQLCAIIGDPVKHSFSPRMHNAAYEAANLNFVYLAFAVKPETLKNAIASMRDLNIRGFSVTIPHKQKVIPFLDEIDPVAAKIGAVNTIVNNEGKLKGYNTDWEGCMQAISEKCSLEGKKVAVLGAGGAARAIAFGAQAKKAQVCIFNRTVAKAEKLAQEINCEFDALENFAQHEIDIVINATSVGMDPNINQSPLPAESLQSGFIVMDTVYNPSETKLIQFAKAKKCPIVYGSEMLLWQGVRQFELFTNQKAPVETMRQALKK